MRAGVGAAWWHTGARAMRGVASSPDETLLESHSAELCTTSARRTPAQRLVFRGPKARGASGRGMSALGCSTVGHDTSAMVSWTAM